jgi:hypothetical protein
VRVRGGTSTIRIYSETFDLIATHTRSNEAGACVTQLDHLPPQKVPGLLRTRETAQAEAAAIGPATQQVVATLLDEPAIDRLPMVHRLLGLREPYGAERLEAACAWALQQQDALSHGSIKRILEQSLDQQPDPATPDAPPATSFVRSAQELLGHLFGEMSAWT